MGDQLVELIQKHTEETTVISHFGCACGWKPGSQTYAFGHNDWCEHLASVFRRYLNERPVIRKAPSKFEGVA